MATIRQKRAKEILDRGECKTMKEVMKRAGYSESTIDKPSQKLTNSKGFQELENIATKQLNQQSDSFNIKNSVKGLLQWLYDHRDSLDHKEKIMLIKISSEVMKSNPELFGQQQSSLEDAIQRMRERLRGNL